MRAMALDRSMLALSTDALVAHDSGDIDGFDAKAEAVALLGQQADEAMIRLEAPVCAAL
jgi:hypothetical protein